MTPGCDAPTGDSSARHSRHSARTCSSGRQPTCHQAAVRGMRYRRKSFDEATKLVTLSRMLFMKSVVIRDAAPSDYEIICTLNLAEVQHTSPMDAARLATLGNLSCYHKVACVNARVSAF